MVLNMFRIYAWRITDLFFPSQAEVYAPNVDQMHVVDHVKGQPTQEKRNVLVESARIARGNIKDLTKLDVKGLDALIIPGRSLCGVCRPVILEQLRYT